MLPLKETRSSKPKGTYRIAFVLNDNDFDVDVQFDWNGYESMVATYSAVKTITVSAHTEEYFRGHNGDSYFVNKSITSTPVLPNVRGASRTFDVMRLFFDPGVSFAAPTGRSELFGRTGVWSEAFLAYKLRFP